MCDPREVRVTRVHTPPGGSTSGADTQTQRRTLLALPLSRLPANSPPPPSHIMRRLRKHCWGLPRELASCFQIGWELLTECSGGLPLPAASVPRPPSRPTNLDPSLCSALTQSYSEATFQKRKLRPRVALPLAQGDTGRKRCPGPESPGPEL